MDVKQLIDRTNQDWDAIAGESLDVQFSKGVLYAFGSELGTLRLLKTFRDTSTAAHAFSDNLDSFYFSINTPF